MKENRKFEKEKRNWKLQGHTWRPFENLAKLLQEKGLYPKKEEKK